MCSKLQIRMFYFFPLILGVILYHQTDTELKTERAIMYRFPNQSITTRAAVKTFKYNRTYTALNFSAGYDRDVNQELMVTVQAYGFHSNEYRLGVIYMHLNVCEALGRNAYGFVNFFDCGNFTSCPIKKGYYEVCNWGPRYTEFPPFLPEGRYRLDFTLSYRKQNLYRLEWYIILESTKFKKFG